MQDMATIAGGLAGIAGAGGAVSVAVLRRKRPSIPAGHALLPQTDIDPLPGVLRLGLTGMTVPVAPGPHGELFLGPGQPQPGRTLRRLVLAPLFTRAQAGGGRLYRDQREPFRLVVEFGGPSRDAETLFRAYRMLDQQLRDHASLLSRCRGGVLTPRVVTVTVTGIVDVRELLAAQRDRYAFADATFDDIGSRSAPPSLAPSISESWSRRFGWDGREPITAEERHQLHALVRAAHDDGRTVRISGLPTGPRRVRAAIWTELGAAGVDVIADGDLSGLARHLRRHPVGAAPLPYLPTRTVRRHTPRPNARRETV
ncbi:putative secreted protein [Actinoplanes missouriensis 431]|uniref:Putative secreted protein n=2 Tax=Actinoplanes missouriensis TaxID=1866 RepID=I0HIR5_ACTM4|nr:putative secreted protein [Actinoplanes missouriensis 431]